MWGQVYARGVDSSKKGQKGLEGNSEAVNNLTHSEPPSFGAHTVMGVPFEHFAAFVPVPVADHQSLNNGVRPARVA